MATLIIDNIVGRRPFRMIDRPVYCTDLKHAADVVSDVDFEKISMTRCYSTSVLREIREEQPNAAIYIMLARGQNLSEKEIAEAKSYGAELDDQTRRKNCWGNIVMTEEEAARGY